MKALTLTDGGANSLKWLALVLMVGDHVNKYLFNATLPWFFEAGRLCAPLFVLVFAWNLARPSNAARAHVVARRLVGVGAIASLPFIALGKLENGWYPLNILFSLACVAGVVALNQRSVTLGQAGKRSARDVAFVGAFMMFLVGGGLVEFWWPLIALGVAARSYFVRPSVGAVVAVALSMLGLCLINQNAWALLALPLLVVVGQLGLNVPRARWFFYAFYPIHLTALWLIRIPMAKAGYLFF
jgi:hypothetical protein